MSVTDEGRSHWMEPAPMLEVQVLPNRDQVVVEATGELCLATIGKLSDPLDGLGGGFARIILDLSGVTFLDSTGIRMLMQTDARARELGFEFALVVPEGQPARTLELVGLTDRPTRISRAELESITDGEGSPRDGGSAPT